MPLRSRLPNTGLKLKIPSRRPHSVSPYRPRLSASPARRRGLPPSPARSPASRPVASPDQAPDRVPRWDAAVDCRPVWAVQQPEACPAPPATRDGYRAIPIKQVGGGDWGRGQAEPLRDCRGRAEHLRDWFHDLSPRIRTTRNPFFGPPRTIADISYQSTKYLSSPVAVFNNCDDLSPSR